MSVTYAFYSVKGGVGKSAITTASAVAFARAGRHVAVIDADLSGTSIADGLQLRAPRPVASNGACGIDGMEGRHPLLSRHETMRIRRERDEIASAVRLPYFDTLITTKPRPVFDPIATAWVHDDVPAIRWYPSSPSPQDTAAAVESMMRDGAFGRRIVWAINTIREALGSDGVALVDLPPGMFGVGTWVAQVDCVTPVFITTDDRNDLYRSAHEYWRLRHGFSATRWILNRNRRAPTDVRADLRGYLGDLFPGIEHELRELGPDSDLERLFRTDQLQVTPQLASRILHLLEDR